MTAELTNIRREFLEGLGENVITKRLVGGMERTDEQRWVHSDLKKHVVLFEFFPSDSLAQPLVENDGCGTTCGTFASGNPPEILLGKVRLTISFALLSADCVPSGFLPKRRSEIRELSPGKRASIPGPNPKTRFLAAFLRNAVRANLASGCVSPAHPRVCVLMKSLRVALCLPTLLNRLEVGCKSFWGDFWAVLLQGFVANLDFVLSRRFVDH